MLRIALLLLLVAATQLLRAQSNTGPYVHVAAGANFSFAIQDNGTLWAWGSNLYGQLGDGSSTTRMNPVAIAEPATAAPGSRWTRIYAQSQPVHGLRSDNTLWQWGNSAFQTVQIPLAASQPAVGRHTKRPGH